MRFWKYLALDNLRPPELLCFDHLYSEYLTIKGRIKDQEAVAFIDKLHSKVREEDEASGGKVAIDETRQSDSLSWNDLYYFELILADSIPIEKLRSKIVRLRSDYRSIASEKEFSEYLGAKPPDLQSPPEPADPPDGTPAHYEKLLREDLKDLLGRMYIKYAILPVREKRLTDLTLFAARLCLISLVALLGILLVVFIVPLVIEMGSAYGRGGLSEATKAFGSSATLSSLTIFVVVVCGAMGGFVSALQRIQAPSTEGDSLYNLSLLFHGSKSVFVAPISGAIFAILLYLMFAASILQGTFFPYIYTPGGINAETLAATRALSQANSEGSPPANSRAGFVTPSPVRSPEAAAPADAANTVNLAQSNSANTNSKPVNADQGNSNSNSATPGTSPTPAATPTPAKGPDDKKPDEAAKGLNIFDFLARSGPGRGKDYALLIIWCFIAGFAERFVPDALDRLIANGNKPGKK
jgi:hypothetical protein